MQRREIRRSLESKGYKTTVHNSSRDLPLKWRVPNVSVSGAEVVLKSGRTWLPPIPVNMDDCYGLTLEQAIRETVRSRTATVKYVTIFREDEFSRKQADSYPIGHSYWLSIRIPRVPFLRRNSRPQYHNQPSL